jgi:hypothetical protein
MRGKSLYEFTCLCGRRYETAEPAAFACAACGRMLVMEWRGASTAPDPIFLNDLREPQDEPPTCSVSNPA